MSLGQRLMISEVPSSYLYCKKLKAGRDYRSRSLENFRIVTSSKTLQLLKRYNFEKKIVLKLPDNGSSDSEHQEDGFLTHHLRITKGILGYTVRFSISSRRSWENPGFCTSYLDSPEQRRCNTGKSREARSELAKSRPCATWNAVWSMSVTWPRS